MLINWEIESPQNVASFLLASGTLLNVLTYSVIKCVSVKRKSITLKHVLMCFQLAFGSSMLCP